MPEDLKRQIIEAIATADDENYKRLLMLLFRVEEVFIDRVDALAEQMAEKVEALANQMTVPPKEHAEDHNWVASARKTEGGVRQVVFKVFVSIVEKGSLVAAGAIAGRLMGAY